MLFLNIFNISSSSFSYIIELLFDCSNLKFLANSLSALFSPIFVSIDGTFVWLTRICSLPFNIPHFNISPIFSLNFLYCNNSDILFFLLSNKLFSNNNLIFSLISFVLIKLILGKLFNKFVNSSTRNQLPILYLANIGFLKLIANSIFFFSFFPSFFISCFTVSLSYCIEPWELKFFIYSIKFRFISFLYVLLLIYMF